MLNQNERGGKSLFVFVFINYFLEYMYMSSLLKKKIIEIYMQYFYYYNYLGIHMFALLLPIAADTQLAVSKLWFGFKITLIFKITE